MQDPALRPGDPLAATNILKERHYGWGDIDAEKADFVVENSYSFPMVTQFAIEPHGFIATGRKRCSEDLESGSASFPIAKNHGGAFRSAIDAGSRVCS